MWVAVKLPAIRMHPPLLRKYFLFFMEKVVSICAAYSSYALYGILAFQNCCSHSTMV